jgi:hypothetical protein
MTQDTATPRCPHCGSALRPFQLPDNTGWDSPIHFACFDDGCPYFVRGWTWMQERYGVRSSYRYRVDPASGQDSPLPVWSNDAIKDRILDAEVIAGPPGADLSTEETGKRQEEGKRQDAKGKSRKKKDSTKTPDGASKGRTPAAKPGGKGRKP